VRCRALSRMARVYANRGRSEADSSSAQALSLSEGLSNKTQAEALQARGETLLYSDPATARKLLNRARDLFREANDPNGEAQALLMLAYIESRKDRAEAVHLAAESLRLEGSEKNSYGIAQVRKFLGWFAADADDFETAQCNYKDALPVFQAIG